MAQHNSTVSPTSRGARETRTDRDFIFNVLPQEGETPDAITNQLYFNFDYYSVRILRFHSQNRRRRKEIKCICPYAFNQMIHALYDSIFYNTCRSVTHITARYPTEEDTPRGTQTHRDHFTILNVNHDYTNLSDHAHTISIVERFPFDDYYQRDDTWITFQQEELSAEGNRATYCALKQKLARLIARARQELDAERAAAYPPAC